MDRLTVYDLEHGRYKTSADSENFFLVREPGIVDNGVYTQGGKCWIFGDFVDKLAELENNEEERNRIKPIELKPCPFCGKYPFVKRHSIGTRGHKFAITQSIECYCGMAKTKLCDTIFDVGFGNEFVIETDGMAEAIEAWNGRAADAEN